MTNLADERKQVVFGNDSIVIQKFITGIKGGRSLDVTGVTADYLPAGLVIITDGKGVYKPMPMGVSEEGEPTGAYGALPAGHSYAGILVSSIPTKRAMASIMTVGQVNSAALPYEVPAAFKTACPGITYTKDEASV